MADERTVHQKGPSVFFVLRYMKHYPDIYIYIYSVFFLPVKKQILPVKKMEICAREKINARENT